MTIEQIEQWVHEHAATVIIACDIQRYTAFTVTIEAGGAKCTTPGRWDLVDSLNVAIETFEAKHEGAAHRATTRTIGEAAAAAPRESISLGDAALALPHVEKQIGALEAHRASLEANALPDEKRVADARIGALSARRDMLHTVIFGA